jgi:hypothetical protein
MKSVIKITAIKIAAISIVTVLAMLSCAPEVELTKRDYKEYRDAKNPKYTNNRGSSLQPTVIANLIYDSVPISDSDKEITIRFDKTADILKETNDGIAVKLKNIFSLYTYNNPAVKPDVYTPSILGSALSYTFVRRDGFDGTDIIIKLDPVPNRSSIVYKIDASLYKCSGQLVDINEDGTAGDAYDDIYDILYVTNGAVCSDPISGWGWTNNFYAPVLTLNLSIFPSPAATYLYGGSFDNTSYVALVTISSSPITGTAQGRKILTDIKSNIELQKYNQNDKKWNKDGLIEVYDSSLPAPAWGSFTYDCLYVNYSAEDLGLYRVKATGMANLTSVDNIGEKPAKIMVNNSFFNNTVYDAPVIHYKSTRKWETSNPLSTPVPNVTVNSDANKKNVVLELYFDSIEDTNLLPIAGYVYPELILIEQFNANFKLVYNGAANQSGTPIGSGVSLANYTNLVELKIIEVKYDASKQTDPNNTNIDRITITLDTSYRIDGNRAISLLLNTGFKYNGGNITFGANSDIKDSFYNGTFGWRSYGQLATGFKL